MHGLPIAFSYPIFMALLEYLYVDSVDVTSELALPLFAAADFLVRSRWPEAVFLQQPLHI